MDAGAFIGPFTVLLGNLSRFGKGLSSGVSKIGEAVGIYGAKLAHFTLKSLHFHGPLPSKQWAACSSHAGALWAPASYLQVPASYLPASKAATLALDQLLLYKLGDIFFAKATYWWRRGLVSMRGCHLDRRGLPLRDLFGVAAVAMLLAACGGEAQTSTAPVSSAAAASSVPSRPASAPAQPAVSSGAGPAASPSASPSATGFALPVPPAPAAVVVDPQTSALLILDLNAQICGPNPTCVATIPAVSVLLKKARQAKVPVIYSQGRAAAAVLPDIAPQADEPTVSGPADKFFGTNLDDLLKQRKASTLLMVGTSSNGAPLYTAFEANVRGYTVVIAQDGVSQQNPADLAAALYQYLHEPGFANADNKPLADKSITLSRSDLISFK